MFCAECGCACELTLCNMALRTAFIVTLAACSHFCHVEGNTTPETRRSTECIELSVPLLRSTSSSWALTWLCTAVAMLQTFRDEMVKVGPHWAYALETWTCPTPAALSNGSCDPCGWDIWWVQLDFRFATVMQMNQCAFNTCTALQVRKLATRRLPRRIHRR